MLTIEGEYLNWNLLENSRCHAVVTMTFEQVQKYTESKTFDALTGEGEQRESTITHARKLKKEMSAGTYCPTSISASLRKTHRKHLQINENAYHLTIDEKDPLARIDGNHRANALLMVKQELEAQLADEKYAHSHEWIQAQLATIDSLPFIVVIYFDGDPREDFIRIQQKKTVDRTHMISLGIRSRNEQSPHMQTAFDIGTKLHADTESPLYLQVRFDTRGVGIPFSSISSKGSSDLIGSLVGLARVGDTFGVTDASQLAKFVSTAYQTILKKSPDLVAYGNQGKVLTSPANGGARGASSMLVGLGTLLAYRVLSQGKTKPSTHDLALMVEAAQVHLDEAAFGNLSGPSKRVLLREFSADFLGGLEESYHDRIPERLVRSLSASSFVVSSLPRATRSRSRRRQPTNDSSPIAPTQQTAAKRRSKKSSQA